MYLLIFETGEYSDWQMFPIAIIPSEEKATQLASKLQEFTDEFCKTDDNYGMYSSKLFIDGVKKILNIEVDELYITYTGGEWYVSKMPVIK